MAKLDNKKHLKNGKITSLLNSIDFPVNYTQKPKFNSLEIKKYSPSKTRKKKK